MNGSFAITTGTMDCGTLASGTVIASLSNPVGSGRNMLLKRLSLKSGFVGTPAASALAVAVTRATGTAAGGTGSKATSGIPKRWGGVADSVGTFRFGPAAITGLTPDTVGDMLGSIVPHQIESSFDELYAEEDIPDQPIMILPGTSLAIITRSVSVAGSLVALNIEWNE